MVVPAEVVDVLLSLKQHFRLLQQICGTCSCGSQTGCAGFRPRPKILSCVGPGPNQWISRAHQRSSWPTPTAFAHIITHPGQLVRYPKALQSAPRVPNSIKLLQYMYGQTFACADVHHVSEHQKTLCLWDKMHMSMIMAFILLRTA